LNIAKFFRISPKVNLTGMKRSSGFTLIETMTTVGVSAILLSLSAPDFSGFVKTNRIRTMSDTLFTSLQQARQQAIGTNSKSYVCRTQAFIDSNWSCTTSGVNATDWGMGWLMYRAQGGVTTGTNVKIQDLEASVTVRRGMVISASQVEENGTIVTSNLNAGDVVTFLPNGAVATSTGTTPVRFAICDTRDNPESEGRLIEISASGRVRVTDTTTATATDCTPS
jgi:type IV fimbrial biogenesis protein FimT